MSRKRNAHTSNPQGHAAGIAEAVPGGRWKKAGIGASLVLLVLLVYGQTLGHGFINYDDDQYVYDNPRVQQGLGVDGVAWAFTHVVCANWHPLTTLSHMLDCQVYGLWAGGHHLTNVLLHAGVAVLLFVVLWEMTGSVWRSAFVAAVFAVHPLRAESVAWVSERKDVLSGLFFMLTLGAYTRYVRGPKTWQAYALVSLWFVLGLLSKPMLVTVPFVLLLLDYWPLGRLQKAGQFPRLMAEKMPLLALSGLSCIATVWAQKEAIQTLDHFPLFVRLGNALVSYVVYLGKGFWPSGLALYYPPPPAGWPPGMVIGAFVLLGAITVGVWMARSKAPCLIVGWCWYVGMLVPVIGLLQVGTQAYADRYTYLPQLGLVAAATWALTGWTGNGHHRRVALGIGAALVLCVLAGMAWLQASYWRDSVMLWRHTLEVTGKNAVAHNSLGQALRTLGRDEEALAEFQEAIKINPGFAEAYNNLGCILIDRGHTGEAMDHFRESIRFNQAHGKAHNNLGNVLFQEGQTAEAIGHIEKALKLQPGNVGTLQNLAWMLATAPQAGLRNGPRAVELARQALKSGGDGNPLGWYILAAAYAETGAFPDAVQAAEVALQWAGKQSNGVLMDKVRHDIQLYQSRQKWRETAE